MVFSRLKTKVSYETSKEHNIDYLSLSIDRLYFLKNISAGKEKPLGQQVKERREHLGISQRELAERVGISQPSLSSIEKGHSTPRDVTLFALARELNDEFGSDLALNYLVRRSSWDREMRPMLMAIQRNDLYLDLLVYRLARMSKRFRTMIKPEPLADVNMRAENLIEILGESVSDEVGPLQPVANRDIMLAPHLGEVDGGEDEEELPRRRTG